MREHALIFDFGNVVAFFDYGKTCGRLGARIGESGEVFRQRISGGGFAGLLAQFESGRVAPEEFATAMAAISGLDLPYREFVEVWQDIFWLNEPVARLIQDLKSRGYTLLLGSNTNVLHATHYRRLFRPTPHFLPHPTFSSNIASSIP